MLISSLRAIDDEGDSNIEDTIGIVYILLSEFDKDIFEISSITHFGIDDLLNKINETLKTEEEFSYDKDEFEDEVYIKFKKDKPYEITKDGDTWVVTGKEIERLFNMTKFTEEEGVLRFGRILRAMGVEETLEKMGAKPGDDVAINDYLFTYKG